MVRWIVGISIVALWTCHCLRPSDKSFEHFLGELEEEERNSILVETNAAKEYAKMQESGPTGDLESLIRKLFFIGQDQVALSMNVETKKRPLRREHPRLPLPGQRTMSQSRLRPEPLEDPKFWIRLSLAISFGLTLTFLLYNIFKLLFICVFRQDDPVFFEKIEGVRNVKTSL